MPIRILGFVSHVISIGVTTDRIPGVSPIVSAGLSTLSEVFEDLHYFFGGETESAHEHSHDLPTQIIRLALSPLDGLSAFRHWAGAKFIKDPVSLSDAWSMSFYGHIKQEHHQEAVPKTNELSPEWQQQRVLMQLAEQADRYEPDQPLAQDKRAIFTRLHKEVASVDCNAADAKQSMASKLTLTEQDQQTLSQHRHFFHIPGEKTHANEFAEDHLVTAQMNF